MATFYSFQWSFYWRNDLLRDENSDWKYQHNRVEKWFLTKHPSKNKSSILFGRLYIASLNTPFQSYSDKVGCDLWFMRHLCLILMCQNSFLLKGPSQVHRVFVAYSIKTFVKIAIGSWLLAIIVIVNAYAGAKAAMMAVPHWEPIFNSLDDVIASGRFKITSEMGTSLNEQFLVGFLHI